MNYYIYTHSNPTTQEIFYVGLASKCKTSNRSKNFHQRGKHWKNYVTKYGLPIVNIVKDDLTKEEACLLETKLIQQYGRKHFECNGQLVNISVGGEGGRRGSINSPYTRMLSSIKLKGIPKPLGFGDKVKANRNHKNASVKILISNQKHYLKGSERNEKISKSLKGRIVTWTGDHIEQYSLEGEFIQDWVSIRQAGLSIAKTSGETIRKCLKGFQKTAYGYIWKYKE